MTHPPPDATPRSGTVAIVSSTIHGIDVSAYQHPPYAAAPIDWREVAASGKRFAIIKATEGGPGGRVYTNPHFARDRDAARAAGLLVGSYHFLRWERGAASPEAQAEHYARVVGDAAEQLVACDLEWIRGQTRPAGDIVDITHAFLERVETLLGRWPLIYTGPSFWRWCLAPALGTRELTLSSWPLWIVDYTPTPKRQPDAMIGAPAWRWSIWQTTGHGSCPGVEGECDLNVARDWETLRQLAGLPLEAKGA